MCSGDVVLQVHQGMQQRESAATHILLFFSPAGFIADLRENYTVYEYIGYTTNIAAINNMKLQSELFLQYKKCPQLKEFWEKKLEC